MCNHTLSAKAITERMLNEVYPKVQKIFPEIKTCTNKSFISKQIENLYQATDNLQVEFNSLVNYEAKLVFPAILEVFNTKHNNSFKPRANINELIKLTKSKEAVIADLVEEIEIELEEMNADKSHPAYRLIKFFDRDYKGLKSEWYYMLEGWNSSCACFRKNALQKNELNGQYQ